MGAELLQGLLTKDQLNELCRRWHVAELWAFGSVLHPDFGPGSDIDLLVTFLSDVEPNLLTRVHLQHELEELTGRSVDLVSRTAIERSHNWLRRQAILGSAQKVYDGATAQVVAG